MSAAIPEVIPGKVAGQARETESGTLDFKMWQKNHSTTE
jgi:hypothetical protein